ncbi:hypothetical protein DPMN_030289 [Dreissena polymorpha]|uniref:Uncharacterized protein n=1 Tax=Dreissena polymorpha TaxID=45954 RepID=A0A9D4RG86_DREPO|nr:hypothetical protein DPMN_030289 [Dreissena polymorpha]
MHENSNIQTDERVLTDEGVRFPVDQLMVFCIQVRDLSIQRPQAKEPFCCESC